MNSKTDSYKRFYIKTLGCKVNQYESQAMREILAKADFKECLTEDIADIYIVNTCTVTHKADRESRYWMGFFHRKNPDAKIVVTGCYVEKDADLISFLPGIAHIVKNSDKGRIADILNERSDQQRTIEPMAISAFKNHTKAFVKIQDGCENFCSYCKVPYVRGRFMSRPASEIIEEVRRLAQNGFKEVVLTGICLGAWGHDPDTKAITANLAGIDVGIVDALKAIEKIDLDFRIRLSSIEPKYVTDELIDFIAQSRKMCRHLHIPLQSGDDDILTRMNRHYSSGEYMALISKVRAKIKDVGITTDIMVGFPGETDENFKNTVNFIKALLPLKAHVFTFSRRKGTAAYGLGEDIPREILKKRYYSIEAAALSASYLYRRDFLGRKLNVLVESTRDKYSNSLEGYSDNYIKVSFEGPDSLMGHIVPVEITGLMLGSTFGVSENP